jgi:hypothetical protein
MATPIGKNQYGDDIYQTPNGQKTGTQITQELQAAGWTGQGGDPVAVYNRTAAAGQQTNTSTTAPTSSTPTVGGGINQQALVESLKQGLSPFFSQTAGFSREELAERARQFDVGIQQIETQWQREGLPRLEIDQRLQALREWQAQQDIQMQRSSLGLQYLTTAANMGGPASVFQQADFLRGARQRGDVPGFLGDLASNTQLPAFTGAGNASIIPQTPGGLSLQLGAGQTVSIPGSGAPMTTAPAPAPAPGAAAPAPAPTAQSPMLGVHETFPEGTWIGLRKDLYGPAPNVFGQYINGVIVPRSDSEYFAAGSPHTVDMSKEHFAEMQRPAPVAPVAPAPVYAPAPVVAPPMAPATVATAPVAGVAPTTATAGLGTDPAGYSYDAALNQIGSIFRAGPTSLAPGSLERLDPNELAILRSGATKLGYDPDAWLRAYSRAGVGQAASSAF